MNPVVRLLRLHVLLSSRLGITPARLSAYWLVTFLFFTTLLYVRSISSRDPGSFFFRPDTAYLPEYSIVRQRQAEHFIVVASSSAPFQSRVSAAPLCVGIPSIAREGARYLRTTVGSLLEGLTQEERNGIHLIAFIAHTNPTVHPAYRETWLSNLVDEVLLYDLPEDELDHVKALELDHGLHREKGLLDYTYLLKACYSTGAPFIAMIEDDVIAMDGWYHRTMSGILQAETRSAKDFLYLRMFYTEEYLGWNSEYWKTYLFWSLSAFCLCTGLLTGIISLYPGFKRIFSLYASVGICLIMVPFAIVLFFAAGKVTVAPLQAGINEMNNYGCCAQGLVYPRHKARDLIEWFQSSHIGFADMLVEQYANDHGEQSWALTPSVLQHIGSKSSKLDDFGHGAKYSKSVAENIWNFAFELNRVEALRKEHESAALVPLTLSR